MRVSRARIGVSLSPSSARDKDMGRGSRIWRDAVRFLDWKDERSATRFFCARHKP